MIILQRAVDAFARCRAQGGGAASEESARLLAIAGEALSGKTRTIITNEIAEEKLSLAEQLWRARAESCAGGSSEDEEPIKLIMEKLAQ